MTPIEVTVTFFLQIAIILGVCRLVGLVARRFGQPQVIAEMLAGVLLGPSLFGQLSPDLQHRLFPEASRPVLYSASQLGLALYMFIVGLEFQGSLLRAQLHRAAAVSIAGIAVPFTLGALLAPALARDDGFFAPGLGVGHAVLFMGAAMSITAFPMLARIIYEKGLTGTRLGTLVLTAGSIDDAAAWCLLAIVLATSGGDMSQAWVTIGGAFVLVLVLVMVAAWITDSIGIHAVFGTFILGASMPRGALAKDVLRRVEPLTVALLVPLFFVYSGLNTRIGLLNSAALWGLALVVLLVACLGKAAACALAARLNGEDWRQSLAIGTLMNARGMMELILLNIGLERGLITPTLFTIMVLMAVVTTLAASPVFTLIYGRSQPDVTPLAAAR